MRLNPCQCGNDDYGLPTKWKENDFGQFTAVASYNLRMPDPFEKEKITHKIKRNISLLFGISLSCWFDNTVYRRVWLLKRRLKRRLNSG